MDWMVLLFASSIEWRAIQIAELLVIGFDPKQPSIQSHSTSFFSFL